MNLGRTVPVIAAALVMLAAGGAAGQTADEMLRSENVPPPFTPASGFGMELMLGGGAADFVHSDIRSVTGTAATWNVRFAAGTRRWVGFELGYVGAAQSIQGLGVPQSRTLMQNGGEGVLRLNAPLTRGTWLLEPFVFGGVGWSNYTVSNTPSGTASLNSQDNVLTVPAGGGFAAGYHGFMFDARFTYRPTFLDDLIVGGGNGSLTSWNVSGQVGYEF
jgi:hypothetical protein